VEVVEMTFREKYQIRTRRSLVTGKLMFLVSDPHGDRVDGGCRPTLAEALEAVAEDIRERRARHTGLCHDLVYTP
jgi:hypothetical protein